MAAMASCLTAEGIGIGLCANVVLGGYRVHLAAMCLSCAPECWTCHTAMHLHVIWIGPASADAHFKIWVLMCTTLSLHCKEPWTDLDLCELVCCHGGQESIKSSCKHILNALTTSVY